MFLDYLFQIPPDLVVDQWVSNVESSSPRDFHIPSDLVVDQWDS